MPAPTPLPDDRRFAWAATIALTALAAFLRLWKVDSAHKFLFDETYYAKDAWSLIHHGYVVSSTGDADQRILAGHLTHLWTGQPEMVVHPEVGKWIIGSSEWLFGMNPYGWRFASAIVGALMVLVMIRLVRRITRSTLLGLVAGVLTCFDGLQFVLSRLALLDIFQAFFVVCAVSALVCDRDWFRERLARWEESGRGRPVFLWRPWLLLSGVWWGLAIGTKWGSIFPLAALGLLFWGWSAIARRDAGIPLAWLRAALADALPAVGYLVVLPLVVYVLTWTGWLLHADAYERYLSHTQYGPYWGDYVNSHPHGFFGKAAKALRSLWHYHHDVYTFHTKFLDHVTHVYQSNPLGWPILNRPVGVDAVLNVKPGAQGCTASPGQTCLREILLLGTPALWWSGCVGLVWGVWGWLGRRDWGYGLALAGFVASWLPWLPNDDRPIFSYYAIVMEPFLVIALTLALRDLARALPERWGRTAAGAVVAAVVVNFAWFWPVYTDGLLTHSQWLERIWFDRWI